MPSNVREVYFGINIWPQTGLKEVCRYGGNIPELILKNYLFFIYPILQNICKNPKPNSSW
jgi:hypothetical protein